MVFTITAHPVHSWEWPLHKGIDLTLLNPETPFLEGHRLAYHGSSVLRICFGGNVRLEALYGPFWFGVGLSQRAGPVDILIPTSIKTLSQPCSIFAFSILFEKGGVPFVKIKLHFENRLGKDTSIRFQIQILHLIQQLE